MKGEKQNMNKLFTKIAKLFLGISMAAGVGVAVSAGRKDASPAQGAAGDKVSFSYTTSSNKKFATAYGANTLADDKISGLSISCTTAKTKGSGVIQNTYNTSFGGQQMTTNANRDTTVTFTFGSPWSGTHATYKEYTQINSVTFTAVAGSSTNYNVACTIDGVAATGDNTGFSATKTTCTFTPASGHNKGVIVFTVSYSSGSKGWYFDKLGINAEVPAPAKTLSSISLGGTYDTQFTVGDTFNHTGMTVTANYSDSTTADKTSSATWSSPDMSTAGQKTVTVSYTEGGTTKTADYSITVSAPATPYITPAKNSTSGYTGQNESLSFIYGNLNGSLSVTSSNTSFVTVGTPSTSAGSGTVQLNFVGAGTTTVKFKDGTTELASVSVTVNASSVTITGLPATATLFEGSTLNLGSQINVSAVGSYTNAVTWLSGNESIATVNASGVVTPVALGTVNITVRANSDNSVSMTCVVTVSEQHGTEAHPYTVQESRDAIDAGTGLANVYGCGIVFSINTPYDSTYKNVSFDISDDGNSTDNFIRAYRCKTGDVTIDSADDVQVGDYVVIYGTLTKYNSIYEFGQGCQLMVRTRKELSSIAVSGQTSSFYVGETFSFGGTVTASYTDSTSADVTASATITPPDLSSTGNKTVNVSYTEGGIEMTTSYTVTVNSRTLSSISVSTAPTKTSYYAGENFDPAGLVITTVWNVGSDGSVSYDDHSSAFEFSPGLDVALTKNHKSVTITYGGKSTAQSITVTQVDRFELITTVEGLSAGCKYVIGNTTGTKFLSTTQNSNNRSAHTLVGTITNNIVAYEEGMEVVELGGSTGLWTLTATNPENNASGATGYLYAAGGTSNNYLRTRASEATWTITFSAGTPTLTSATATGTNARNLLKNNGDLFSCYGSGQTEVALYKLLDTSESVAISKASISGLKTDSDNTVSITANNFTPEDIEVSYSVANVAAVTKGTIDNGVIPLNVSFIGVGTTVATITVKGGESDYDAELTITVAAKPDSLVVSGNGITLVDGGQTVANRRLEIQTGAEKQFSASHFTMIDTDENNMSATANDVTLSRTSGDDVVTFSGAKITAGSTPGSCVVRFASKLVSSVYYEITVNVIADYNVSVNSITYNDDLVDDQGHTLDISEIFKTKVANTHFDSTAPILDSELKFSYDDNDYANAVSADSFVYDFAHGSTSTAFGEGYKDQTVYVYTTFTESRVSLFTITIAQADTPLVSISLDTGSAYNLQRNTTHQLVVSYNPTDTTDNRNVTYSLSGASTGSSISVTSTGLISAGSKAGSVATITATVDPDLDPETDNSVSASVVITVVREEVTIIADLPVIPGSTTITKVTETSQLVSGGKYLIVSESQNSVMDGSQTTDIDKNPISGTFSNGTITNVDDVKGSYFELEISGDDYYLKGSGGKYIYRSSGTSGGSTATSSTKTDDCKNSITFSSGDAVISCKNDSYYLRYNSSSSQFRYYTSQSQTAVQLYVISETPASGGETNVTASSALLDVLDSVMTYSNGSYSLDVCDISGATFNTSAWTSLGNSFTSSIISANKLAYARADENGNEVEQFLAAYDFAVKKYGEDYDFLGRIASGKIVRSQFTSPLALITGQNTNTVVIIVIISMVSVTAIGGYFFLRKRKENN